MVEILKNVKNAVVAYLNVIMVVTWRDCIQPEPRITWTSVGNEGLGRGSDWISHDYTNPKGRIY